MRNAKEPRNCAERRRCPFTPPPTEKHEYGDRAECAVCGKPLDAPPRPEGLRFCGRHDRDDLPERPRDPERESDVIVPERFEP